MSVRPVDFGMVQRLNEVSQIKQNENAKPGIDQTNMMNQFTKETASKSDQVGKKDDADNGQKKFDAKEKGDNSYSGSNPKNKESKEQIEGQVFVKGQKGFDMKI